MRIALVRGSNLNPWELANYDLRADIVAFGSLAGSFDPQAMPIAVRRLPSPVDCVGRLPGLWQNAVHRFAGDTDWLGGLERALRGFDIAHTAELETAYSWQAVRARERGAVRRVVATIWENIAMPPAPFPAIERRITRVARGLDRALAITERARTHLEVAGLPRDRIDVVPMGVDLARFTPVVRDRRSGPLRILSVSRLVSEKGVEDLVVAVSLLTARGIDVRATLVGDGPLRRRLALMATQLGVAGRVTLAGSVPHDGLHEIHRQHDVFVLASGPRATWQEQFGFAVVEAMASGLPVLAGDSGSLGEVVGDREQLVTPHQPVALADALAALAADADRAAALGAANRRRAEKRYDRNLVARQIETFYERALASSPRSTAK